MQTSIKIMHRIKYKHSFLFVFYSAINSETQDTAITEDDKTLYIITII